MYLSVSLYLDLYLYLCAQGFPGVSLDMMLLLMGAAVNINIMILIYVYMANVFKANVQYEVKSLNYTSKQNNNT